MHNFNELNIKVKSSLSHRWTIMWNHSKLH